MNKRTLCAIVIGWASAAHAQFLLDADLRMLYTRAESVAPGQPPVVDEDSYTPPVPFAEDLHQIVSKAVSAAGEPTAASFLFGAMHKLTLQAQGSCGGDTRGAGDGEVFVSAWTRFGVDFHLDEENQCVVTAQLITQEGTSASLRILKDGIEIYSKGASGGQSPFIADHMTLSPGNYTWEMFCEAEWMTSNTAVNQHLFGSFNGSLHSFAPSPGTAAASLLAAGLFGGRRRRRELGPGLALGR